MDRYKCWCVCVHLSACVGGKIYVCVWIGNELVGCKGMYMYAYIVCMVEYSVRWIGNKISCVMKFAV